MANINLQTQTYTIVQNSKIEGKLYSGSTNSIPQRIVGPYKKGTLSLDNVPPKGSITISKTTKGLIDFTYLAKENFLGDDSFEFILEYADGSRYYQIVNINIKEKSTNMFVSERYIDVYFDKLEQSNLVKNIETKYKNALEIPTSISYSSLKQDLIGIKKTSFHDLVNTYNSIIEPTTKTQIETRTTYTNYNNEANNKKIRALINIEIIINKNPLFFGNEYGVVKFKDFVNKIDGNNSDVEEHIYINWKLRPITYNYKNEAIDIVVPDFEELPKPNFIYPDVNFPEAPTQDSSLSPVSSKTGGNLLDGTKAHNELDSRGNNSIKVGKKVPQDAVNLAYYYNTTSNITDTMSVIETNMNNVELHYVEEWIHKRGLPKRDDDLFPEFIEFEGEKNTDLEGYAGTLYREYVMWEEQTIADLDPQIKVVHQEYRGLTKDDLDNIPIIWNFEDEDRQGKLERTNTVVEAIAFNKGMPKTYTCYARFEGLTTKKTTRYHGSGKYGGLVTKIDGMANIDPEQPREIIMFPDDYGLLKRENGDPLLDDELFYITDKFKDDVPLYYKHRLKYRVYDSIGPDKYGVYKSNNLKLMLENNYNFDDDNNKWQVFLEPTNWNNIYDAYIYTSFIPSVEVPVYVVYDGMPNEAYVGGEKINPINTKVGITEKLSVYPAIHNSEYVVKRQESIAKQSTITMNEISVIADERTPIPIEFNIMADDMESPSFNVEVMNYKYAIYAEKDKFINEEMIASSKTAGGYMTAKDMFINSASQEQIEKITDDTIFRIRYDNFGGDTLFNKDKVIMYTDTSGCGLVMAMTYVDTGLPGEMADDSDTPRMNKNVPKGFIYKIENKKIYKGYSVMCRNINQITIHAPIENNPLKSWLPAINYSYFNKTYERIDKTIQLVYSVPEFYSQIYSDYCRPYVEVKNENPINLGNSRVKVSRYPIYIEPSIDWLPKNIEGRKVLPNGTKRKLTVKSYNFKYGIIEFEDKISYNDKIEIDYTYEEEFYHYRGYYLNSDPNSEMIKINLNPNMYNYYTDNKDEVFYNANVYNLFNRTIHFYLRPMRVIDKSNGSILEENKFTLYHRIDKQEAISPFDLHIGRIFIRHHTSLKSTKVIDTRKRGGGILESISDNLRRELEPESDDYLDIGTLDGKPYHENSVVIIKVDERMLTKNGGRFSEYQIKEAIQKWSAYGMFPIIEYVKVLYDEELPQSTLEISQQVENITRFKPYIETIVVEED